MSPIKDDVGTISRMPKEKFSETGVVIREVEDGTRCEGCKNICAGYKPHEWRKTCQSCKCPREAHAIYQEQLTSVRERLGFKPSSENQSSGIDPRQLGYTWVPHGVMTSAKIQRYFDKIPQDKVPKIGTSGERYRERQLTYQLPKQDLSKEYCKHLEGAQQLASYEDFVAARNEIALDIGYIKDAQQNTKCINCNERISKSELAVIAPKFLDSMLWHPECFCCTTCDELLVDLTYCVHEDKIYCERHYAEMLKPRCSACDEEITETEDSDSEKERQKQEEREKRRKEKERQKSKNVSMYEIDQKTPSPPARNIDASAYSNKDQTSFETDENIVHDQKTDELMQTLSSKLRRSPRQGDMEYYEEKFIEEERKASRTPSPQPAKSRTPEISEYKSEEIHTTTNVISTDEEVDESSLDTSIDRTQAPTIEIEYASDTQLSEEDFEEEPEEPTDAPMEGISDFYDFNASINPSRSRSRSPSPNRLPPRLPSRSSSRTPSERRSQSQSRISDTVLISRSKSREPSPSPFQTNSEEASLSQKRSRSMSPQILFTVTDTSGYSDWYDYCVMLNRRAYGIKVENFREVHQSSTDFLMSQLKATNNIEHKNESIEHEPTNEIQSSPECVGGKPTSKKKSPSPEINRKKSDSIQSFTFEDNLTEGSLEHGTEPPTPEYPRSFSIELKDTERLREEYERLFKRSTYASESLDFSDEFEELREKTRHFRRSRSRSRSPADKDLENIQIGAITRRKLQEKILAQITKTTLDFQDFAKDINREFLDYERRGSDSALIQQKSQILIQFQDNQLKNGEDDEDVMEAEEYHHFRRFSLNLEQQVEEYPDDDYVYEEYIQQIDLSNLDIIKENDQLKDDYVSTEKLIEIPLASYEINGIDQLVEDAEDDQEDSGSDDERQTVVEVDDEIDEDICDFEKSDEFNEQSECEEADREVDRYANRNAGDWKEEGAVGGVTEWENINDDRENVANIEDMYNDIGEENMEKDYETIIEAMNNEERNKNAISNGFNDDASIKTEDLLEEILKEEEERYKRLSPKFNGRHNLKRSSQNFIDNEKEDDVPYYISTSTVIHHNTASTRLRSRYGLPPTTFRNFDYEVDDIEVDLNYKPKKEYNWRKNFKIEDDDESTTTSKSRSPNGEENPNFLNPRKYSLGGESITIYSRSVESEERQLEIMAMDDEKHQIEYTLRKNNEISEYSNGFQENGEVLQDEMELLSSPKNEEIYEQNENIVEEEDKSNSVSKKKKLKKKSRKGSKANIDDEEFSKLNFEDSVQLNDDQATSSSKKKIKKKKKTKVEVISENISPDFKSPEPEPEILLKASNSKALESKTNNSFKISKPKSPEAEPEIKLKSSELNVLESKTNNSFNVSKSKPPEIEKKNIETKTVLENIKQVDSDRLSPNSEISNNNNNIINSLKTRASPNNEILNTKAFSPQPENLTRISPSNEISDAKANSPHLINDKISKSPELINASIVQTSENGFDIIKDGGMYPLF